MQSQSSHDFLAHLSPLEGHEHPSLSTSPAVVPTLSTATYGGSLYGSPFLDSRIPISSISYLQSPPFGGNIASPLVLPVTQGDAISSRVLPDPHGQLCPAGGFPYLHPPATRLDPMSPHHKAYMYPISSVASSTAETEIPTSPQPQFASSGITAPHTRDLLSRPTTPVTILAVVEAPGSPSQIQITPLEFPSRLYAPPRPINPRIPSPFLNPFSSTYPAPPEHDNIFDEPRGHEAAVATRHDLRAQLTGQLASRPGAIWRQPRQGLLTPGLGFYQKYEGEDSSRQLSNSTTHYGEMAFPQSHSWSAAVTVKGHLSTSPPGSYITGAHHANSRHYVSSSLTSSSSCLFSQNWDHFTNVTASPSSLLRNPVCPLRALSMMDHIYS
ncbi:hypothetical protein DL93DRAFT_2165123 [Clavulina sp. PMI_390]|nr:hypothetical protein DL93DRAFT_2165123 [Clavulina sp. PMI_390]